MKILLLKLRCRLNLEFASAKNFESTEKFKIQDLTPTLHVRKWLVTASFYHIHTLTNRLIQREFCRGLSQN